LGKPCIAFAKYDGNNLRWEWSAKRGWYKSGTRTQLFDASHPIYGEAVALFAGGLGDGIVRCSRNAKRGVQRVVAFTEFFGPGTFAGIHKEGDPKELRLFDVDLGNGLVRPRDFVRWYGGLPAAAQVVYEGNLNKQFIEDVRNGVYPVHEGVVDKGDGFMVKVKTNAYMARLMEVYGATWRNYWE
jgi:hypothetical protein